MKPILKWTGGKERELPIIRENLPEYKGRYIEPFVGGGAVFFDIENHKSVINDKSKELINFYDCIKHYPDELKAVLLNMEASFSYLSLFVDSHKVKVLKVYNSELSIEDFSKQYFETNEMNLKGFNDDFIKEIKKNLKLKISRSKKIDEEKKNFSDENKLNNIECALKSAYYMYIRSLYNHEANAKNFQKAAWFFFIREFCYSSMFRYNAKGEFNVPYGGISYNRKDLKKKIDYMFSPEMLEKLNNTKIYNLDFEDFMDEINLTSNDFIFLDPPYDTEFSSYSNNEFGRDEQIRLRNYLKNTSAKFMLVIKNTDFICDLYNSPEFKIKSFNKKYSVSFMSRNDRTVEHLIITNY